MASDLIHPKMCGVAEIQMSLQTKSLEVAYERNVGSCMLAVKNEENRRVRLQETLIREEAYRLREELEEANVCKKDLALALHEAETAQNRNKAVFERMRDALKSKDRKLQQLQTELDARGESRTEVQKVLAEKMYLEHELAAAKQQAEHFRTVASSFQATMSEKLALEREKMTLLVELETEKKATQRALAREKEQAEQCAEYEAQIAQLRRDLAKEKRSRKNAELEAQQLRDEEDSRQTALEKKANAYKALKEQLKQTESELQKVRAEASAAAVAAAATASAATAATAAASAEAEAAREAERPAKRPRKRKEPEPAVEAVSTPPDKGAMSRALAKKRKPGVSTLPGEKSAFSTTPFIRRTASFALENSADDAEPEAAEAEAEEEEEEAVQEVEAEAEAEPQAAEPEAPPAKKRAVKRAPRAPKAAAAEGAAAAAGKAKKPRVRGVKRATAAAAAAPPLSQVVEEGNEEADGEPEQQPPAAMPLAEEKAGSAVAGGHGSDGQAMMSEERAEEQPLEEPAAPAPAPLAAAVLVPAPRPAPARKTRVKKLANTSGNRTIFDEDEVAAAPAARSLRALPSGSNPAPPLGRVATLKKTSAAQAFGFSPLKKDRKAAGAG